MADTKTTGLTENTTPATTDIMYIVDDPGGSALSQKITLANLKTIFNDITTDAEWDAAGDLVYGTGANTADRLAIGTANQVLRVNSGATAPEWASVGRVLISEQTPTGTTVTWSSIPATYKSLEIELMGRCDRAGQPNETVNLYFNNDTTATNYYRQSTSATGTTVATATSDTPAVIALPAATATANYAGAAIVQVLDYAGTTFHKIANVRNTRREAATTASTNFQDLQWESTTAINRVDLITVNGSNFIAGTVARLYGVY